MRELDCGHSHAAEILTSMVQAASTMGPYWYEKLPDADSIRLLTVEPLGSNVDDVRGSLHTVSLNRVHKYTALSYSWAMDNGDASINRNITVDGRALGVTQNLYEGLQRLFAGTQQQRPIWIDAVCINQSSTDERNSQVARMGQIYSYAEEVICWLGNGSSALDVANIAIVMECFSYPRHSTFREHKLTSGEGRALHTCLAGAAVTATGTLIRAGERSDGDMAACIAGLFEDIDLRLIASETQQVMKMFFMRRYWSRRWIVQELCQARSRLSFQLSDYAFSEQQVESAIHHAASLGFRCSVSGFFDFDIDPRDEDPVLYQAQYLVQRTLELRKEYRTAGSRGIPLADSILNCHGLMCSDPRDIVFSLVSLDNDSAVQADYGMTLAQVFTSFVVDLLQRLKFIKSYTGLPGILICAAKTRSLRTHEGSIASVLPSWVPDLRRRAYMGSLPPIGSWDILPTNGLSCSALIVGTLSPDLNSVESSATNPVTDQTQYYTIRSKPNHFDKTRCCHGDLVCLFDDVDDIVSVSDDNFAIVLHPIGNIQNGYRIVNCLNFVPTVWIPGTHALQTVCIY